ncbi:hypothetical protein [Rhodothalassium salexigens]|uniref:hypothetical protein n=1 Tax=Rhodothalassium salexigens TaxID=1086 RepID=UPI00160C8663|nr:hypothetical protein [Rhodothalassium salexigens]MBB4212752.1 hypothetical protein [Rhodothalassium salexigens DSM 2132]MBK1638956.1 hypothetical protein [Rhodothalassium salexigens DSM 2132]
MTRWKQLGLLVFSGSSVDVAASRARLGEAGLCYPGEGNKPGQGNSQGNNSGNKGNNRGNRSGQGADAPGAGEAEPDQTPERAPAAMAPETGPATGPHPDSEPVAADDGVAAASAELGLTPAAVRAEVAELADLLGGSELLTKFEAETVKENYLAALRKLEYDRAAETVVDVSAVAAAVAKEYAQVRTAMLAIPTSLAPRLAQMTDVAAVQALLSEAVTEALERLAYDTKTP